MRYQLLGQTGLYVSELCLGTMTFGGKGHWQNIGRLQLDDATALVKKSFDAGINFIDTANVYSLGESGVADRAGHIRKLGLPRDQLVMRHQSHGNDG